MPAAHELDEPKPIDVESIDGRVVFGNSPPALALMILRDTGVRTIPLPNAQEITIGRAGECDIPIDDNKLSRLHAKLRIGRVIEILDMGSRNGTSVGGKALKPNQPRELNVGESITVGSTVLVVLDGAAARPRHIWAHGYFEARLEEECARATESSETFCVIRVRVQGEEGRLPTEEILATWLRKTDILGIYAPGDYEILRPQARPEDADAATAELRRRLEGAGLRSRTGVACFPRDARASEVLIMRAGGAAMPTVPPEAPTLPPVKNGFMAALEPTLAKFASSDINVLILGETGVGKEVLARTVHERSTRAGKPLVSVNCAALSETLLESELFGHEKGAFTGAVSPKAGLIESADGGTFFLDELAEMPLQTQVKLLRVLEQREVTRVGALRPRSINVRFIAATNREIEREIQLGRFRQDLFFRLNGIVVSIPPLRERVDEIEPLATSFANETAKRLGRPPMRIDFAAMELLKRYAWPGNVRELRNVIERAVVLCSGPVITSQYLPIEKMGPTVIAPHATAEIRRTSERVPAADRMSRHNSTPLPPPPLFNEEESEETKSFRGLTPYSDDEKQAVIQALERCAGNQTHAARLLGISRRTLITRIEQYDLPRPRKRVE